MAYRRKPKVDPNAGVLSCRVSPREAERFEALAASMGLGVSSLLRRFVARVNETQSLDVDVIQAARDQAAAEAHGEVARIVQFSLVPYFRELKDYSDQLQREGRELQERFKSYLRLLKSLTEDMAAYADDLRPLIERYAPDALEDEVKMT
jgi:antitoxin component of RelBE/YafQ-DinJ toxin-antitoxin module